MIPEIGVFCLILAGCLGILQVMMATGALGQSHLSSRLCATTVFLFASMALGCLVWSHATSDFSVLNVIEHSHTAKPMIYKITGAWGNHEGSMLLWFWVLTLYGFLVAQSRTANHRLVSGTLGVQAAIGILICLYILFLSNPFKRVFPPPQNGDDLNPLLQDLGLAIHPPMLYLGYVGFSIVFSFAAMGIWQNGIDKQWARIVHPWILLAWGTLTLGIGLGSWWAYRELGWGGFWFWDPVENASLLPWLAGTALLHCNSVLMRSDTLRRWVALLAIITFSLSLLGTFLVRSGLLTSVHSFASDPERGVYILLMIALITGVALFVYSYKTPAASHTSTPMLSRGGLILVNNLLMLSTCATVMLATLYPLMADLFAGMQVAIGPGYYNATALPMLAFSLCFAAIAPLLSWEEGGAKPIGILRIMALFASAAATLAAFTVQREMLLSVIGVALCAWLFTGSIAIAWRYGSQGQTFSMRRLFGMPLYKHGVYVAHIGAAMLALGITGAGLWSETFEIAMKPGDSVMLGSYEVRYESSKSKSPLSATNYTVERSRFSVLKNGEETAILEPEIRHYMFRNMQTAEAAIDYGITRDIYLITGTSPKDGQVILRAYIKPFIAFLWAGFLVMALGGFIAACNPLRAKQAI